MGTLIGTWRLQSEKAWDASGEPAKTLFGDTPEGIAVYHANGRMMAVSVNGSVGAVEGTRGYASYCGAWSFDGHRLVVQADVGSDEHFLSVSQVRDVRFEGDKIILRPPEGFLGAQGIIREFVWQRVN